MQQWKNYLAGLVWASIFGLSFLVTKGALDVFSPFELLFLRFTVATLVLTLLARLKVITLSYKGKPRLPLVLLCLFQPIIYFFCETFGLRETASSTAGLILGALPACVALLSLVMLKERLSFWQALGLVVSVAGVALIVLAGRSADGGSDSARGILLILGALVSATFFNVYSRKASAIYSPVETTFAMMASGAVFFGILAEVERMSRGGPGLIARATPAAWGAVAYLGLLSSVVAFFLVNYTLSRLKASQSAVFATVTTLVALVAGIIVRGEYAGPLKLCGAAMIIVGVWGTNAMKRGPAPASADTPETRP
jgi:drug/metabolite transporter (DMT)-like permease